jgi:hypothetical protein
MSTRANKEKKKERAFGTAMKSAGPESTERIEQNTRTT